MHAFSPPLFSLSLPKTFTVKTQETWVLPFPVKKPMPRAPGNNHLLGILGSLRAQKIRAPRTTKARL